MKLFELLEIRPGVTAVAGSGGKTSLLRRLAAELPGTVLLCTTTHIYPFPEFPLLENPTPEAIRAAFRRSRAVCAGTPEPGTGKLTALPFSSAGLADFVLAEADGSRGLPLKAHGPGEPVIPPDAGQTVLVLGLSGLGRPIAEVCHRAERFAALCGAQPGDPATPVRTAAVCRREGLADRYFLNQAEGREAEGRRLAALLDRPCVLGSLEKGVYDAC